MAAFQMLGPSQAIPFGTLSMWPFLPEETLYALLAQVDLPRCAFSFTPCLAPSPAPKRTSRLADFSIRSILATEDTLQVGASQHRNSDMEPQEHFQDDPASAGATRGEYSWIHCTRFKPPRIPKIKKEGAPRRTSRSPRVPFSSFQLSILEGSFRRTRYLSTNQVREISRELGLTENRVKIWFQNRRARERREFLRSHAAASPRQERQATSALHTTATRDQA